MATAPEQTVDIGSGFPPDAVIAHLLAQPGVQRTPGARLVLFQRRGVLEPALCEALCDQIDVRRRPSTVSDFNGDPSYRTSETCDLDPGDPLVAEVDRRITALTGLGPAYGEPIQGQRYAVGQEFKQHTDYFEPDGVDFARFTAVSGNRSWTVMIYLNEPAAGGGTRFRTIDKIVAPATGKLLAWCNLRADGSPNPATLHAGMKVRAGVKYVITKWFRERPWG